MCSYENSSFRSYTHIGKVISNFTHMKFCYFSYHVGNCFENIEISSYCVQVSPKARKNRQIGVFLCFNVAVKSGEPALGGKAESKRSREVKSLN